MARRTVYKVEISLTEVQRLGKERLYELYIPGFGNPGCVVRARNATEANARVAGFIGNALMAEQELESA